MFEVHLVGAVDFFQRVIHHLTPVALRRQSEGMIDGWLDNHFLILLHKHVDSHTDALHDARYIGEPLTLDVPLVVVLNPLSDAGPQRIWHHRVAKERVLQSLAQGICDKLRCLKIHVGHPQGQQVATAIALLQHFVLQVATPRAVNYFIEIVLYTHSGSKFFTIHYSLFPQPSACRISFRMSSLFSNPIDRRMVV